MSDRDSSARFNQAMCAIYYTAKRELGYNASLILRMLSQHGRAETARRLVMAPHMSDGYAFSGTTTGLIR